MCNVEHRFLRAAVVGILALSPTLAVASGSCVSSFREMKNPDGAIFYMASSAYPGLDARKALEDYAEVAADLGYTIVVRPNHSDEAPTLGLGKLPSPHPTAIMFDRASSAITVTTIVAAGERANATEERTRLCALVAEFDARRPGAGPRKTAAELQNDARTTLPSAIPSVRVLSPTARFDLAAAKAALEPGRSVIRGQACGHYKGSIAYGSGSRVYLYPATPYLDEVMRLAKKAKPGRDQLLPDADAMATRMEATANERGEFQFSQMKPGRYLLMTRISAVLAGSRDVYAGRVDDAYGSSNVYRTEGYTFDAANDLIEYVDVRNDGDVVKVTLQPSVSPNIFRRGLTGSILGCRQLP